MDEAVTKKAMKANEARVGKLYGKYCFGIQVSIMSLGTIMDVGMEALRAGADDEGIGTAMRTYVETIRKN